MNYYNEHDPKKESKTADVVEVVAKALFVARGHPAKHWKTQCAEGKEPFYRNAKAAIKAIEGYGKQD